MMLAIVLAISTTFITFAPLAYADDGDTSSTTPDSTSSPQADTPQTTTDDTVASTSDATIVTGDASSSSDTNNNVNANTTTGSTSSPQADAASTTVDNTNDATTSNDTSSTATTGDNIATSTGGDASVTTGTAISQANVINVVNTNITNSSGLLAFINALGAEGYDLSSLFGSLSSAVNSGCSLSSCGGSHTSLNVNNDNNATVTNTVLSVASTGGNTASSSGDASVATGDAIASANVLNVVNTNITNSQYLLVALNNFGDLAGNIVLPNASFFDQLLANNGLTKSTTVSNINTADVTNTTTATANTGDNTASSTSGDAAVSTGNALSNSTTVNQVNTNDTGGATVYMLVNIFGNWTGSIQGLPAGLSWTQTPNGIAITGNESSFSNLGGSTNVSNANTATVNNDVQVYALTGSNYAEGSGTSTVSTGNAYASANVVNLVNTNILGENWVLAIMNVFGNWSGNLDFGQPDLWIGAVAETSNPTQPGSSVTYTFTVANHGNVDATNVVLNASFDTTMLTFSDGTSTPGGELWDLGTIPAGASETYSYTATAGTPPTSDAVSVPLSATVTEDQDDANTSDNTDTVTIAVGDQLPLSTGGLYIGQYTASPKLTITKTESVSNSTIPASVDYKVVVDNDTKAGPAYNSVLEDTIKDPNGKTIYDNSWNLDEIDPGDEITLTYTVQFDASSTPGAYINTSLVTGDKNYSKLPYANAMDPISQSTSLNLVGGQVLGASTTTAACGPYITSYITPAGPNDKANVTRLQIFLAGNEHDPIMPTGVYDASTISYVKQFQQKYASDILTPWGMSAPSGAVYYTTVAKINELYCAGSAKFPLSASQLNEIKSFHASSGSVYGALPPKKHIAAKPISTPPMVVVPSAPAPVFSIPGLQNNADSVLDMIIKNSVSALRVPFANAQSR